MLTGKQNRSGYEMSVMLVLSHLYLLLCLPFTTSSSSSSSSSSSEFTSNVSLPAFRMFQIPPEKHSNSISRSPVSSTPSGFSTILRLKQENDNFAIFAPREAADVSITSKVLIMGNQTILSKNRTFQLGFFSIDGDATWYLGISFASIPTPTFVWVANRGKYFTNLTSSTLEITENGRLAVKESGSIVWQSSNTDVGTQMELLESGNLVLLSPAGKISWQSFDYPADTWIPGMNLTKDRSLTSWRSSSDPSPGLYSLRLKPLDYGEIELVFNATTAYWSTGNWTGEAFTYVPEMTIPYIYSFHFVDPFKPTASFGFAERPMDNGMSPPLTRFHMDYTGQLNQYTWSTQTENWNMFWSRPDNICRVYGICGKFGICSGDSLKPCECPSGFSPVDDRKWKSGDFSGGCRRENYSSCHANDGFEEVGIAGFEEDDIDSITFTGSLSLCKQSCLDNCSCIGLNHQEGANLCRNLYGSLMNLRNLSSDSTGDEKLLLRVQNGGLMAKKKKTKRSNPSVLIFSIIGSVMVLGFLAVMVLVLLKRSRKSKKGGEEDGVSLLNLKVFSYKELHAATRDFSEKLGHGGFGTVFRGELLDSTIVAVKRLDRPGSGEKEFRAEVCTIGNIQHVNLVRLRGFCSENLHRLLVYEYMPRGSLSSYLRREGPTLSWEIRFRIAIGTARGIAYLHEECRDCIIHCDIKPQNILLAADFTAKVSDFGLAKLLGRDFSRVLTTMRGTWGYVAPEWISGVAITPKADVYSYGMTLLELIGGRRYVENVDDTSEKWFFPPWAAQRIAVGNVAEVVDERLCGEYNESEIERVALVAVWCIQDEEARRPTMGMVVKMLEGVVEVAAPQAPKLLQAFVSGAPSSAMEAIGYRFSTQKSGSVCSPVNVSSLADQEDNNVL